MRLSEKTVFGAGIMLKRKIDEYLKSWKTKPDHKPLIIKGARQIGKTTSITSFGRHFYDSFIEINFYEHPEYKNIFENGFNTESVIRNISLINPSFRFIPGSTLIFFDEIQEYMDATTSLKFFVLDGRYDVICSGSALGIKYRHVSSVSVGFKEDIEMYSLDFEEFLWACGYDDSLKKQIVEQMLDLKPFSNLMMSRMKRLFTDYLITGGMPEIVQRFIDNQNFSGILEMQKQLIMDYDDDISKYTEGLDSAKVRNMYRHIAPQLGKENHKFQITKLGHGARAYQYKGCEEWLADAGVVNLCYCVHDLSLPLKGNEIPDNYRMYFSDTSLLIGSLDEESQKDLRINQNFGVYKGAIYENMTAEALKKQGMGLYFYRSKDTRTELDFLIRIRNNIVPLEIKTGRSQARSLNAVILDNKIPDVTYGMKFTGNNIGAENRQFTYPYFCLFVINDLLKNQTGTPFGKKTDEWSVKDHV